ncbi:hypothetical protein KAT24_00200 [Candidatus Pacearchaeota archaeon]|nr:hypothetical protein [Candidatus Pacearchaeota archaeon]
MRLKKFYKTQEEKEQRSSEKLIMMIMDRVVVHEEKNNPKLAFEYLHMATRIYHERLDGYAPRIDKRFNEIFLSFAGKYL